MLPGKIYKPEDFLQILVSRIWWVLLPVAVASAVAAASAHRQPSLYRSDALILVKPPEVSGAAFRNTVSVRVEDRLQATRQRVLSSTNVQQLIRDFGLGQVDANGGIAQDSIARVSGRIEAVPQRGDAFRVSFTHSDADTARAVTARLVSMFIDESELERSQQATSTSVFLETQLAQALATLEKADNDIAAFRQSHIGELPEQQQANMQAQQNLEMRIRVTLDSRDDDLDRRLLLQQTLADLEAQEPTLGGSPVATGGGGAAPTGSAAAELTAARERLAALRARGYTDAHPDVLAEEQNIAALSVKAEAEALAMPLSTAGTVGLPPEELERRRRITDVTDRLAQLELAIADKDKDLERFRDEVEVYDRRVNIAPTLQTELIALNRNYGIFKDQYETLLRRKEDARMAAAAESQGGNLQLLNAASLPTRPTSPNKPRLIMSGVGVGLGLGVALIVLFEYRDRSFSTDTEVAEILSLPVLAVVPFMQSDAEVRKARARHWLFGLGFGGTVLGCLAVVVYTVTR